MIERMDRQVTVRQPLGRAAARFRPRNAIGFVHVSTQAWGPDAGSALRSYVLSQAVSADLHIGSIADLSRATGIKPSVFSKWFSGAEQPSVKSLEKLAPVIKAPLRDLLVLACRVRPEDLGLEAAPEPPKVVGHPLARELDGLLADSSPLPEVERKAITAFLDQYLEPYRRSARLRSRGRRNTA